MRTSIFSYFHREQVVFCKEYGFNQHAHFGNKLGVEGA